jgi:hypothetical protein
MNPADEMAAKPDAAGFGGEPDQQLRTILENLERVNPVEEDEPVERDDLRPGLTSRLDLEASERKAIHDRLVAMENQTKKRRSRGFTRYLVAVLIGVAATLAWQSYGDAGKQVIATKAPELGWSPEARKMITSWVPVGWTKPPAGSEKQVVPVAQTAPQNVAPKAPTTASLDPEQLQQITQSLTTLRETVEHLTAGQDQMTRVIGRLESAVAELITKMPEPPPRPPAAPARKPMPVPPSSRAPGTPPTSLAPRPPPHP